MRLLSCLASLLATATLCEAVVANMRGPASKNVFTSNRNGGMRKGPKYFKEPGRGNVYGHYDLRYYKQPVSYNVKAEILLSLTRAWLETTASEGLETWLAHGTLLGWWWNAKLLPWDWDLDVQISEATLHTIVAKYNMTHWPYTAVDGSRHEYLLDVNPYSNERERGNAMNMIDARWIDKESGLFIDITALSETHPDSRPNMIVCKNYHRYHINDIYPLRDTLFEGVPAKVPYAYDKILIKEYRSKALTLTEYEGHRWNAQTKLWDPAFAIPVDEKGSQGVPKVPTQTLQRTRQIPDPHGMDAVPDRGIMENLYRLVHYW